MLRVVVASSLGTLFEWYDFFLYGSLAVFFGHLFFPAGNDTAQLLASLATFGAGFCVRPLGGVLFGHLGDRIGRKYTFLLTMGSMGFATALIGLLPTYDTAGLGATVLLVGLRLVQGLALGGEYGGATTYVAEHVADDRRGFYTSFIQTTAVLGFLLSMIVIGTTRIALGEDTFRAWGWRVPFLLSFVLLGVSLYIRMKMAESPVFAELKATGGVSKNPIKESFTNALNLRYVLVALFGICAAQGVVSYAAEFYALTFMEATLKIGWRTSYLLVSISAVLTTPLFVFFGWLSDRIGRKVIMMTGCALGALTFVPIYAGLKHFSNPGGLPVADPAQINGPAVVLLLTLLLVYFCMTYGPIAAFLVELFPARIRYTSLSVPYHLGNGWFGGFLPFVATAISSSAWARAHFGAGAVYAGLAYPIGICLVSLVVGGLWMRDAPRAPAL
ncbi:MAG TPA: MFS transporter [Polyangiaceae bacterium]